MNVIKENWFSEVNELWPGCCFSLEFTDVLYEGKSDYQDIKVLQTRSHGRALILDGIIQCTDSDEFAYQEMISYLPLNSHPNPKNILVVGGGDGGVVRDAAKFPTVESVDMVEIDEMVVNVCKKFFPNMAAGFNDPKVTLFIEDGHEYIKKHQSTYDVIITDSSDPVGPNTSLFQQQYFQLLKSALRPNGIICCQAGTMWSQSESIKETMKICREFFPVVEYGVTYVPTYPSGQIGFVLCSLNKDVNFREPVINFTDDELNTMGMKYYNPNVHRAAFALPRFGEKILGVGLS